MNERIEKELSGLAVKLGKTEEEMLAKYNEIAEANGLDLENERNGMVALTLTRNFARGSLKGNKSSSKKGGFGNDAFGFIVGSEPSRDVQEWKRKNLVSDYTSNSNTVFNEERCAEVVLTEAGYEKSQIIDGEVKTKIIPQLPKSSIEVDEDKWIVPIDNIKSFMSGDSNPRYGKPLPQEEFRRRVHLIAKKEGGEYQYWTFGLKNDLAKEWDIETFRWLHLNALFNDDRNACYGIKVRTVNSLQYNDNLDESDDMFVGTLPSMEDLLVEHMGDWIADLLEIEDYHAQIMSNPGMKLCITDGIVSSMNLQVNEKTGNRVLWIEPADAAYGFEDDDVPESTPCWIPSNVDIDFGVGSDVIIIGRTNQSPKKDSDGNKIEDEMNPVSFNIFGILPRVALGAPQETKSNESDDTLNYW
tara:strand:+ start:824 stop:2068 length:1245 start_codon:yes stop_codon:yes gene_type:complete